MKKNLNEAFVVDRGKDRNGNIIAYINPNKPENKESFKFKDIFKNHGAKWDGINKFWFWYIGKTEDQWKAQFDRFIKPALADVHKAEGAPENDAQAAVMSSLNTIISAVENTPIATNSEVKVSPEQEQDIKNKLQLFKQKLVNIENDEDFKKTMSIITKFKNAQGYKFSFGNAILIWIQNPNATIVNNKTNWEKIYNRTVNPNAKPLMVYAPQTVGGNTIKGNKDQITADFLKALNKTDVSQLTPNEKIRLQSALRGFTYATKFKFVPVYDVKDTTQKEGTEDFIKGTEEYHKIKWSDENNIDPKVTPIYNGLKGYAESLGINVNDQIENMGGAKGSSANGKIQVLKNNGDDVGLTKTLAHELAHEILHQSYAKAKDTSLGQYFIGKEQGRKAMEQQAEIAAWMIMDAFGYDMKTTSLNYALLWGGNKDSMVKVFDTVANAVNKIIDGTKAHMGSPAQEQPAGAETEVAEAAAPEQDHVSGFDVAKFIGVEDQYKEVVQQHQQLRETFFRYAKYKING